MAKNQLSSQDKLFIEEFNKQFNAIFDTLERAKQFKLDDYLILYISGYDGVMRLDLNSYGAPNKFKVVFATEHGIPFIKRVNKKGEPVGSIYSCVGTQNDSYRKMDQKFQFELDPDYADSILLQDEYDPAQLHRSKKDIWKAVTDHNKNVKVKTEDVKDVVNFFKEVNIGDMVWTSNIGHYLIQDKKTMTPKDFNDKAKWADKTSMRGPLIQVLTIRDKKGKVKDVSPNFFHGKALYRERPRTYKELNI
jgi:hypothetical protein